MNGKLKPFRRGILDVDFEEMRKRFPDVPEEDLKKEFDRALNDIVYINDEYQINVSQRKRYTHLSIKRLDKEPIHDWRDLQAIKSKILGDEVEAVELYPAESRLVDTANQYHLWALRYEDGSPVFFHFGFNDGRFVHDNYNEAQNNIKQRPL